MRIWTHDFSQGFRKGSASEVFDSAHWKRCCDVGDHRVPRTAGTCHYLPRSVYEYTNGLMEDIHDESKGEQETTFLLDRIVEGSSQRMISPLLNPRPIAFTYHLECTMTSNVPHLVSWLGHTQACKIWYIDKKRSQERPNTAQPRHPTRTIHPGTKRIPRSYVVPRTGGGIHSRIP